jgi:hypothetical protein
MPERVLGGLQSSVSKVTWRCCGGYGIANLSFLVSKPLANFEQFVVRQARVCGRDIDAALKRDPNKLAHFLALHQILHSVFLSPKIQLGTRS